MPVCPSSRCTSVFVPLLERHAPHDSHRVLSWQLSCCHQKFHKLFPVAGSTSRMDVYSDTVSGAPHDTDALRLSGYLPAVCASCIRSSIQYQERSGEAGCPHCRASCEARDLQQALQLRAICAAFVAARPVLLSAMQVRPTAIVDVRHHLHQILSSKARSSCTFMQCWPHYSQLSRRCCRNAPTAADDSLQGE